MWDYWSKTAETLYDDATGAVEQVYGDATANAADIREFAQGEVSKTTSQVGTLAETGADTVADNTPGGLLDKVKEHVVVVSVITGVVGFGALAWRVLG